MIFQIEGLLLKKAGNDYKKLPFHLGPMKFCDYLKHSSFYAALVESSDIPRRGECPWPQRKYKVHGYRAPTDKILPYFEGDFMIEIRILQGENLLNGFRLFASIINIGDESD